MLDQDIQKRFLQLPPSHQKLITSGFAEETAELFAENLRLSEEETAVFENGLVLMLMYIFNEQDLKEYLTTHTKADPTEIGSVTKAISRIIEGRPAAPTLPAPISSTYAPIAQSSNPAPMRAPLPTNLAQEIKEAEEMLQNSPAIRTMAGDISALKHSDPPTYQSSQTEILQPTPPPAAPTAHPPRWETDN